MKKIKIIISCVLPLILGILGVLFFIFLKDKYDIEYYNINGLKEVLTAIISLGSIIIGFYSAFFGILISLKNSGFFLKLSESEYKNLFIYMLLVSLISAFITVINSIALLILVNYKNFYIKYIFYFWIFITIYFIYYAFRISILSIIIIFGNEPKKIKKESI